MNYKILNIRNILKIIISILIIFSMLKSCAKAWAWEDFIEFGHTIDRYNYAGTSDLTNGISTLFTYKEVIEEKINVEDYSSFIFKTEYNTSSPRGYRYKIYAFNLSSSSVISIGNNSLSISNISGKYVSGYSNMNSPTISDITSFSNSGSNANSWYWLIDDATITNYANWYGNNYYAYAVQRVSDITSNETIVADAKLPQALIGTSNVWKFYIGSDYVQDLNVYYSTIGIAGNIQMLTTTDAETLNNNTYNIRLFVDGTEKYQSPDYYYTVHYNPNPGGTSGDSGTISSGDLLCGCVPYLKEISGKLDNINTNVETSAQQIQQLNETIGNTAENIGKILYNPSGDESGESKGIFQKIFEELMTIDSGDWQDIKKQLEEELELEERSGIGQEIELFENMNSMEPTDFIISWQPVEYEEAIIIPSGEINFSKQIRENPAFTRIHEVTRIIIIAAFSYLILFNYWKTTCVMLGIGTELYDHYDDEERIVESQHQVIDERTGRETLTTTYRRGNKSISFKR